MVSKALLKYKCDGRDVKAPIATGYSVLVSTMSKKTHYSVNEHWRDWQPGYVKEKTTFIIKIINQSQRPIKTLFCPWDKSSTHERVGHLHTFQFLVSHLGNVHKFIENTVWSEVCDRHSHVGKWDSKCETFFSVPLASLEIITTCSLEVNPWEVNNFKSLFINPLSWSFPFLSWAWMKKLIFQNALNNIQVFCICRQNMQNH